MTDARGPSGAGSSHGGAAALRRVGGRIALAVAALSATWALIATCGTGAGDDAGRGMRGDGMRGGGRGEHGPAEGDGDPRYAGGSEPAKVGNATRSSRRRAGAPPPAEVADTPDAAPTWEPFVRVKWPDGTPAASAVAMIGDLDGGDNGSGLRESEPGVFPSDEFVSYWHISAAAVRDGEVWVGQEDADGPAVGSITLRKAEPWEDARFVRVVGPNGEHVAQAHVDRVRGRPRWGFEDDAWGDRGFSIAGGRFVFQSWRWQPSADPVVFLVRAAVGGDGTPFGCALVECDSSDPLERTVTLPPGGTVRGRVVDAAGEPVPRAKVTLDPPRPAGFDGDHMASPRIDSVTDEAGEFAFAGVCMGTGSLLVSRDFSAAAPVRVETGAEPVTIHLDTSIFRCGVRVLGPDGAPVAAPSVTPTWPTERKWVVSREDDIEWIEVGRGLAIDVRVDAPGCTPARVSGWRPEPGEVCTVLLDAPAVTTVTVIGPDGRVVDFPPLRVSDAEDRDIPGARIRRWAGEWTVTGAPPGAPLRLEVHDGISTVAVRETVSGAKDVHVMWTEDHGRLVLLRRSDDMRPLAVTVLAEGLEIASGAWYGSAYAFETGAWPEHVDVAVRDRDRGYPDDAVAGRAPNLTIVRGVPRRGVREVWPVRGARRTVTLAFTRDDGAPPGPVAATLTHACGATVSGETDRFGSVEFTLPGGTPFRGQAADLSGLWRATFEVEGADADARTEVTLTKSP